MPFGICQECGVNQHCKTIAATKKYNDAMRKQNKNWTDKTNMIICKSCYTGETPWDSLGH